MCLNISSARCKIIRAQPWKCERPRGNDSPPSLLLPSGVKREFIMRERVFMSVVFVHSKDWRKNAVFEHSCNFK